MATIIKKTDHKPVPENAQVIVRKGVQYARWVDKRGRHRTALLSPDGSKVLIERPAWYVVYFDATKQRVTIKGSRDKEATQALADRLEREVARAKQGLAPITDPALAQTPWDQALERWLAQLQHDNCDDVYVANMRRLVSKVAGACNWTTLASIRADSVQDWLVAVKQNGVPDPVGKVKKGLPSDRTVDQYLEVCQRFLNWCVGQSPAILAENPLAGLKKIQKPKRVRKRRAISEAKLRHLILMSGERGRVYRTAALTGLRKDELRQLEWRDVRLGIAEPHIQLRPEANKSRRDDKVPLNTEVASELAALRPEAAGPMDRVFTSIPTVKTLRSDLKKAEIPYKDIEGRQFDFHSFRYCFCTMLARANVPIRTAIELMRHRDPKLTLQIYTDAGQLETSEAVGRLPKLS